jgi:uncharacterized protein (DUF302 family)
MTSTISIEHVVVESDRAYEAVTGALESRLGDFRDVAVLRSKLGAGGASPERIAEVVEKLAGPSGLGLFHKVDHGQMLAAAGTPRRVCQYAIGNPMLAAKMILHAPGVALYAPLRVAVYENSEGGTSVAYDRFSSLVAQFDSGAAVTVAGIVQQKLEALVAEITGCSNTLPK